MSLYSIRNFSFTYPEGERAALESISMEINEGEFIVLCGRSGCGKTTLLRQLKTCLAPAGSSSGEILFGGRPLSEAGDREQASEIGFVMQDAEAQIVTDKVWHELAFGLESLGMKTDEIRRRVAEMACFFGIQEWFRRDVKELSGGQKQLLNLAAVMVMDPKVLILDEPTAQLDPLAAESFFTMLKKLNSETGITIIISEHRSEEILPLCSRVAVMESGRIICDDTPKKAAAAMLGAAGGVADACTSASRIYAAIDGSGEFPVTVKEGRSVLSGRRQLKIPQSETLQDRGEAVAELRDAWFRYEKDAPDVLRGASFKAYKGELVAVLGGNGAGKTTALSLLAGVRLPYRGRVFINGTDIRKIKDIHDGIIGCVPQDPRLLFVKSTLRGELAEAVTDGSMDERLRRAQNAAKLCRLEERLNAHPYDLSGGEQQRAAIAKLLLRSPQILLLDEPTKGMDMASREELAAVLRSLTARGKTVIMVSHDIEFCAKHADRCAMFFDAQVIAAAQTREFFLENKLYTTAAGRIARGIAENAVTVEDVIYSFTGIKNEPPKTNADDILFYEEKRSGEEKNESRLKKYFFGEASEGLRERRKAAPAGIKAAILMLLLFIPLTIFVGVYYLDDRRYYFTALLVIAESILPFAVIYERQRPKPRELVAIAALCAIAVGGRAAFYFLPHFKPMAAIVIISGIAFGSETGFLVGAMSAFVSNFFFWQGPWTPWQMFAFGSIGFLSGLFFRKGACGRVPVSVFGFSVVFVVYSGIMNFANVTMSQYKVTTAALAASYISGVPLDLTHAFATFIFLWVAAVPMLKKLERIRIKYDC